MPEAEAPPTPFLSPTEHAHNAALYRGAMHRMLQLGLTLADRLETDLAASSAPPSDRQRDDRQPDSRSTLIADFERLSRGVRRNVLFAERLNDAAPKATDGPAVQHRNVRRPIARHVTDVIRREAAATAHNGGDDAGDDGDAPNRAAELKAELAERLEGPDLADELDDSRPLDHLIADICRDLGLATVPGGPVSPGVRAWARRTPADIAHLCAQAARPPATRRSKPSASPRHTAAPPSG